MLNIADNEAQDAADAQSIYETLEKQIIPLFYERDINKIPLGGSR